MSSTVVERCENWGACLRLYVPGWTQPSPIGSDMRPIESQHRADRYRTLAPSPAILLDVDDAKVIEEAVAAVPLYQHELLKAWYVRCYSPGKCLNLAAEAARVSRVRFRAFECDLRMAHALLQGALALPAVIRKGYAREFVRQTLAFPACVMDTA